MSAVRLLIPPPGPHAVLIRSHRVVVRQQHGDEPRSGRGDAQPGRQLPCPHLRAVHLHRYPGRADGAHRGYHCLFILLLTPNDPDIRKPPLRALPSDRPPRHDRAVLHAYGR